MLELASRLARLQVPAGAHCQAGLLYTAQRGTSSVKHPYIINHLKILLQAQQPTQLPA